MSVQKHYDNLLAEHYSWMFGDYSIKVKENVEFFKTIEAIPHLSKRAVDLGCGSGFQSVALCDLGFKVLSIDLSSILLEELAERGAGRDIQTVQADILEIQTYLEGEAEIVTCMGDTLTHLESIDKIIELFHKIYDSLEPNGLMCLSFRDMTIEIKGLDRIIQVRADEQKIMTCFLEYEDTYVNVNDIIYCKTDLGWELRKSNYKKLRISGDWVRQRLKECGFKIKLNKNVKGLVNIVGFK